MQCGESGHAYIGSMLANNCSFKCMESRQHGTWLGCVHPLISKHGGWFWPRVPNFRQARRIVLAMYTQFPASMELLFLSICTPLGARLEDSFGSLHLSALIFRHYMPQPNKQVNAYLHTLFVLVIASLMSFLYSSWMRRELTISMNKPSGPSLWRRLIALKKKHTHLLLFRFPSLLSPSPPSPLSLLFPSHSPFPSLSPFSSLSLSPSPSPPSSSVV